MSLLIFRDGSVIFFPHTDRAGQGSGLLRFSLFDQKGQARENVRSTIRSTFPSMLTSMFLLAINVSQSKPISEMRRHHQDRQRRLWY